MKNKLQVNQELPLEYLDLLKKSLTRYISDDGYLNLHQRTHGRLKGMLYSFIKIMLDPFDLELVKHNQFNPKLRKEGKDWPAKAETMIGLHRLDNIQKCMTDILSRDIQGDFIETGVWRGGATIFMRGVLKAYNITNRVVWAADSFKGLPKPTDDRYEEDIKDKLWTFPQLSVSLDDVRENFSKYNLLDDQVKFLAGWFKDTLPLAPIKSLALIRLDGDMYESTIDALRALYPKLSVGGYVIVDDYCLPQCRAAIKDFRSEMKIKDTIHRIDWSGVYWKRS
jgi:O-methyltransferase